MYTWKNISLYKIYIYTLARTIATVKTDSHNVDMAWEYGDEYNCDQEIHILVFLHWIYEVIVLQIQGVCHSERFGGRTVFVFFIFFL